MNGIYIDILIYVTEVDQSEGPKSIFTNKSFIMGSIEYFTEYTLVWISFFHRN